MYDPGRSSKSFCCLALSDVLQLGCMGGNLKALTVRINPKWLDKSLSLESDFWKWKNGCDNESTVTGSQSGQTRATVLHSIFAPRLSLQKEIKWWESGFKAGVAVTDSEGQGTCYCVSDSYVRTRASALDIPW